MAPEPTIATGKQEPDAVAAGVPRRPSLLAFLGGMLILTGFATGAGGLAGMQVAARLAAPKAETTAGQSFKGRYAENATLKPLPPIITNLANPTNTWVRLEASIVIEREAEGEASALLAGIAEDFVAFLRTVSLQQIEGPSGFQNLREDLSDRLRVRTQGKARDLVIQAFIVE
jgi:flagellar FliL protein